PWQRGPQEGGLLARRRAGEGHRALGEEADGLLELRCRRGRKWVGRGHRGRRGRRDVRRGGEIHEAWPLVWVAQRGAGEERSSLRGGAPLGRVRGPPTSRELFNPFF